MRRATSAFLIDSRSQKPISIHALLAESDINSRADNVKRHEISIHALLAESDNQPGKPNKLAGLFLSTLSLRRATVLALCSCGGACDFYPRSPCGERPVTTLEGGSDRDFYPRSPCGERPNLNIRQIQKIEFLSTLSLRRATRKYSKSKEYYFYFYPRSPCGERPEYFLTWHFRSEISIHALLAESDLEAPARAFLISYFYPRSPCGERQPDGTITDTFFSISIHALLAESDPPLRFFWC